MAKRKTRKKDPAAASRANGAKGGRPTIYEGKENYGLLKLTPKAARKVVSDAAIIGCSKLDAIEGAIHRFDALEFRRSKDNGADERL